MTFHFEIDRSRHSGIGPIKLTEKQSWKGIFEGGLGLFLEKNSKTLSLESFHIHPRSEMVQTKCLHSLAMQEILKFMVTVLL